MDLVEDCYGYACKGPVAAAIILCLVAAPISQGKSLVKAWWNECYGAAIMIAATQAWIVIEKRYCASARMRAFVAMEGAP